MATHANSTAVPERTLLREVAAPGRLLPAFNPTLDRGAELLAILDAGPIGPEALAGLSRQRRLRAEAGIAALIDYLDAIDVDADLEPSLGSCNPVPPRLGVASISRGRALERWPMADHLAFAHGGSDDTEDVDEDADDLDRGEDEHDGREPDVDDEDGADAERGGDEEPSLGWPEEHHHQQQAGRLASIGSVEGDFDEVRPPGGSGFDRHERLNAARCAAGALLDRHGLQRPGNLGPLIAIRPGGALLARVA